MFKKKGWQYLMIATMILSAMGPIGSVAAAEALAPEQPIEMAQEPIAADDNTQNQVTDTVSNEGQVETESTETQPELVDETPEVQQPETEAETPTVVEPEVEAEAETVEETPAAAEEAAVPEEQAVVANEEEPASEPAAKAVDSITIDTHDVIMFSSSRDTAYSATANVEPGDSEDAVEWDTQGEENSGKKLITFDKKSDDRTIGYYANHETLSKMIINRDPERAGLYVRYLEAKAGNVTERKDITIGGLRAIQTTHENLLDEGLKYTMEAASSLPEGHAWTWEWKVMRANSANNTSGKFEDFGDYYGILNVKGTTKVNPTDQDFAITILPTSSFVEYMANYDPNSDHPLALQLTITSTTDKKLSYYTNFSTVAVDGYIDPGQLSLESVPTMQDAATYNGDDLRAGKTQEHELSGELNILDTRVHPQDGVQDAEFDRWHLHAKVSRFVADADPNTQLKFKFDLTNRAGQPIAQTLDSEHTESSHMLTANEVFKIQKCGIDIVFKPYTSDGLIPTGSYHSTITWELTPAIGSERL